MHHVARRLLEAGLADVVACFLAHDHAPYIRGQVLVGSTAQHFAVEVVVGLREETGAERAVGGDADAAAVAAKRVGDRSDNADFAHAIAEGVAPGGLAGGVRGERDDAGGDRTGGPPGVEAGEDLVHADDDLRCPGGRS